MKLTRPFSLDGKVSGIYFPTGKEATCEFASNNCLNNCFAINHSKDQERIPVEELKEVYQFFKDNTTLTIAGYILKELRDNHIKILHWFVSGDCKQVDEYKVTNVIDQLWEENIIQCGFTRNKSFWDFTNHWTFKDSLTRVPKVTFALTIENKPKALDISLNGLVSFPDFKSGKFQLYKNKRKVVGCGYTDPKLEKINNNDNCLKCYDTKMGCFTPDGK